MERFFAIYSIHLKFIYKMLLAVDTVTKQLYINTDIKWKLTFLMYKFINLHNIIKK